MGSLFGSKTPNPKPPAEMPDDQSPAVLEAKRKAAMDAAARAGRASTILTSGGDNGATYSGKTLGAS